ncbi:hypothetical protein AC480_00575 [miscellaneous Crenarchaeota group archaeon SMTZ1-55]|nr:MAG: hypothetical protein AC480_00575 [miscellaneous Crenarchaeota group archaeon SMTZ1-55]
MSDDTASVKRMADLLKAGATMLFEHCPQCGSPLFKLNDEVRCLTCDKRVVIVKTGDEIPDVSKADLLSDLEIMVLSKLREVSNYVQEETDVTKLTALGSLLATWLDVLEKVRKINKKSTL